jgi:hypothetical protein
VAAFSSVREASGASATLWLGMRVMALLSRRATCSTGPGNVTGKDGAAAGNVTRETAGRPRVGDVTIRPAGPSLLAEPARGTGGARTGRGQGRTGQE